MPAGIKKSNLPSKHCPVCERPFVWRKKWEKNWDTVVYCSERCRQNRKGNQLEEKNVGKSNKNTG